MASEDIKVRRSRDLERYHRQTAERRNCASYCHLSVALGHLFGVRLSLRQPSSGLFGLRCVRNLGQVLGVVVADVSVQKPPTCAISGLWRSIPRVGRRFRRVATTRDRAAAHSAT